MADRVFPSSKPAVPNGAHPPAFPATKAQHYGSSRPTYRPTPEKRRGGGSFCCCIFFWVIVTAVTLFVLAAVAGAIIYVVYRPHRPSFSITSLKLSSLKITASSAIHSKFDFTLSATNPNEKITFYFDPASISILYNDVNVGDGDTLSFAIDKKNTTSLKASAASNGDQALDVGLVRDLKSNLKGNNGVAFQVRLDTKVTAKMGGLKTPKVGVRVSCPGVAAAPPTEKASITASPTNSQCKLDARMKIWKWAV